MTTEPDGACEPSVTQFPGPSHHGGSALGVWIRLCGWFVLMGLAAIGSGVVLAGLGPTSELAVWATLAIVSIPCWLGFRRSTRQLPRHRWCMSSFEVCAIAAIPGLGAGLLLRGTATSATLVSVATLIVAAFAEEFIFRWAPFDLIRRLEGGLRSHVSVAVISAILFLSLHEMEHPALVVDRFVFSLISYCLCVYSGAVWLSWAAHVLTNVIAILVLDGSPSTGGYWLFLGLSTLTVAAVLLASRRLVTRRDRFEIEWATRIQKGAMHDDERLLG